MKTPMSSSPVTSPSSVKLSSPSPSLSSITLSEQDTARFQKWQNIPSLLPKFRLWIDREIVQHVISLSATLQCLNLPSPTMTTSNIPRTLTSNYFISPQSSSVNFDRDSSFVSAFSSTLPVSEPPNTLYARIMTGTTSASKPESSLA